MVNEVKADERLPLVSVCIPAYNHEKYVTEAIQSVIDQDYKNIELIIINDGSKDKTHEVIISFKKLCQDRFARFEYRNRENRGLSKTLNEMVDWSHGKYFSAIASDDILMQNKISLLVEQLENLDDNYAVAFGDASFIDDNSNIIYLNSDGIATLSEKSTNSFLEYYTKDRNIDFRDKNVFGSYASFLSCNYLPAMSCVIKLEQIKEVEAWTNGNTIEDWEMWLKLSRNYKFAFVDESVALYRWHDSNTVKTMKFELVRDSIQLFENEREYAFYRGYKNILYSTLVSMIIQLRIYNKTMFIKKIVQYSINPDFIKAFILKIIHKIQKY